MRKSFSTVSYPALILLIISTIVQCFYMPIVSPIVAWILSLLISLALGQAFSYITCWALVLRKGKNRRYVWINYIVWILILNIGVVTEILEMR